MRGEIDKLKKYEDSKFIEEKNTYGRTPLWLAVAGNHLEITQALITSGADIHTKDVKGHCLIIHGSEN